MSGSRLPLVYHPHHSLPLKIFLLEISEGNESSTTYSYNAEKWADGTNRHPEKDEQFPYLGEIGDFYKIDYKGLVLYVSKQHTHLE